MLPSLRDECNECQEASGITNKELDQARLKASSLALGPAYGTIAGDGVVWVQISAASVVHLSIVHSTLSCSRREWP